MTHTYTHTHNTHTDRRTLADIQEGARTGITLLNTQINQDKNWSNWCGVFMLKCVCDVESAGYHRHSDGAFIVALVIK